MLEGTFSVCNEISAMHKHFTCPQINNIFLINFFFSISISTDLAHFCSLSLPSAVYLYSKDSREVQEHAFRKKKDIMWIIHSHFPGILSELLKELSDKTRAVFRKHPAVKLLFFLALPLCSAVDFSKINIFKIIQAGVLLAVITLTDFRFL